MLKTRILLVAGLIVVGLASAAAVFESRRELIEMRAAAQNFTAVLDQIRHSQLQPAALRGERPAAVWSSTRVSGLLDTIAAEARNFGAETQALERKLGEIVLADALAPEVITSAEGIAASRAKVRAVRALIVKRKKMFQAYVGRMEALLSDAPVAEGEKQRALESFKERKPRFTSAYRELDLAQRTVVARTSAMLDFAMQNLGGAALRNGELQFKAKAQADQYNLLLEQLRHAIAAEAKAVAGMDEMQARARLEAEEAMARLAM